MSAGYRSAQTLLGLSAGALVPPTGGFRLLAFWLGGAGLPVEVPVEAGVPAPVGRPVYIRTKRRRSIEEKIKDLVDLSARELYEDILEAPVPERIKVEAAAVLRPFARSNKLVPPPLAIDWPAVDAELARVREMLRIWEREVLAREMELDDEEVLLASL